MMCEVPGSFKYRLTRALAILTLLALNSPAYAQAPTLELGLLPSLSTRTLFGVYRPLRDYLAHGLKRPVRLITAPDYRTLIERTRRGEYAYLVTAPHFARLAQKESGYLPLVQVARDLGAIVVSSRSTGIKDLQALRGATVATPDRLAIVSMLGVQALIAAGLMPGTDIKIVNYPSFASAVLAAGSGEASAAVTAVTALGQMSQATRQSMMTIAETPRVPAIMVIARGDVDAAERDAIRELFVKFHLAESGNRFFERTRFKRYRIPLDSELESLDPYVQQLKTALAHP